MRTDKDLRETWEQGAKDAEQEAAKAVNAQHRAEAFARAARIREIANQHFGGAR